MKKYAYINIINHSCRATPYTNKHDLLTEAKHYLASVAMIDNPPRAFYKIWGIQECLVSIEGSLFVYRLTLPTNIDEMCMEFLGHFDYLNTDNKLYDLLTDMQRTIIMAKIVASIKVTRYIRLNKITD